MNMLATGLAIVLIIFGFAATATSAPLGILILAAVAGIFGGWVLARGKFDALGIAAGAFALVLTMAWVAISLTSKPVDDTVFEPASAHRPTYSAGAASI
jgi:apolipoprotein N-acyltransferase